MEIPACVPKIALVNSAMNEAEVTRLLAVEDVQTGNRVVVNVEGVQGEGWRGGW